MNTEQEIEFIRRKKKQPWLVKKPENQAKVDFEGLKTKMCV